MGPPDRRRGERLEAPAPESIALADDTHILDDISVRDVLLAQIIALGPDALFAASLGWRLGRLDAEEVAKQRIADAGCDVAGSPEWQAVRRAPRWAELQRRRGECVRRHRLDHCTCRSAAP